jgi:hypothetical protein
LVNELTTRLLHCMTERGVLSNVGDDQFRVALDHLELGNNTSPGRPRLESTPLSDGGSDGAFHTADQGTMNPALQAATGGDDGGNDGNNAGGGTQSAPPVPPTNGQQVGAGGGGVNVGAGPSGVNGGGTNKGNDNKDNANTGACGGGIVVDVNVDLGDDDDSKGDDKDDVTSRSAFQRIKSALTPLRKKVKDEMIELRMSEYSFKYFTALFPKLSLW